MYLHCKVCLTSRTGDALGQPCRTSGCNGIIEEIPPFHTLVDVLPEPMTCGRRAESGMDNHSVFQNGGAGLDRWQKFKTNGNRVCSYCGSLHPDDMFDLVQTSAFAPLDAAYRSVIEVEYSDKSYKIYVWQPGVRNAHEGGIKFYTHHLPRDSNRDFDIPQQRHAELAQALRGTKYRFDRHLQENDPCEK